MAEPHHLLAMKCVAMRLGEEFHDLEDVRYLLRYLNIENVEPESIPPPMPASRA